VQHYVAAAWIKRVHVSVPLVQEHLHQLGDVDVSKLIPLIAALQLVPENSQYLVRLECSSELLGAYGWREGGRIVPPDELLEWLEESPFAVGDDPLNNLFTDEIVFFGGSYRVFPGSVEEAAYVFRQVTRAVFLGERWPEGRAFQRRIATLAGAVLRLSDTIARRARLKRGLPPEAGSAPSLPDEDRLATLVDAVQFSMRELDELLEEFGGCAVLDPLSQVPGREEIPDQDWGTGTFYARPLLRIADGILVAVPHELVGALNHAVLSTAVTEGLAEELGRRYQRAVHAAVDDRLEFMDVAEVSIGLPTPPTDARYVEGVYAFDSDKLLHLLVLTDDLAAYNPDVLSGVWTEGNLGDTIEPRLSEVEEYLYSLEYAPDAVLHLVVLQGVGRRYFVGFRARLPHLPGLLLVMTAADLDVIALLEHADQLALWRYARAHNRVRDYADIFAWSQLDEFNFYRARDHSYYTSDEGRPDFISIMPDGAAALKAELAKRFDFHGAETPDRGSFIEVALAHADRAIPIYVPFPRSFMRPMMLVEGWPGPLWVVAPSTPPADARYRGIYMQFLDFVSYWLWELTASLSPQIKRVHPAGETLEITVVLVENPHWFMRGDPEETEGATVSWLSDNELEIRFSASITTTLSHGDNTGDRELVRRLIMAFAGGPDRATDSLDSDAVAAVVDAVAPLGLKKKATVYDPRLDPRLNESGLPSVRKIFAAEEALLLDDVGAFLFARTPVGALEGEEAHRVLNEVVAYHFARLEREVATLNPDGLLEWLVAENEALVAHVAHRDLAVPTELNCFAESLDMVERLRKEIPELGRASIASRFLIEYVVARPPDGLRPMSRALYDELLVLSAEIFENGLFSDMLQRSLTDISVSILPSRRLGFSRGGHFEVGRDEWLAVHARGEIKRRSRRFARLSEREGGEAEPPPELEELSAAIEEEFGLGLIDIVYFHHELINIGWETDGEPKQMALPELRARLARSLDWEDEKVARAIELHELRPRTEFLTPGASFRRTDVYPWRFNRELSYVRRPILIRVGTNGQEEAVWGVRHVYSASRNFFELCTGGRLRARTQRLSRLLNRWRAEDALEFNNRVADLFRGRETAIVKVRVTRFGRLRIERERGHQISDIDVFVADREHREILAIETKALVVGRTAAELENERARTFEGSEGQRSDVDKLLDVVAWLEQHLARVLATLGLDTSTKGWSVRPLLVVEAELLTPFITHVAVPVVAFHDLEEMLQRDERPARAIDGL
jgi:hypothetical protein